MANNDGTLNFDTKIDSSGFQKGLSFTGKMLGGATAGVTALGAAAIKVGSDFEAGMSQVQAISGASGEDLERLKDKAKEMGASTKFSATESAEALNYMAMAGWKTEDMLDGIEGIMNLAAASGEDLGTTSDIVTDALTAFGLSAGDAGHFADVLAQASASANTNVSMLGESFKYVAPVAGTLGYSAEDTAIALGLMANAGIKGSQAGTSLRTALTNMVSPTKDMVGVMNQFGIEVEKADGGMKPFGELMDELRGKFRITTEEEREQNYAMAEQRMVADGLGSRLDGLSEEQKKLQLAYYEGIPAVEGLSEAMLKAEAKDRLGIDLTKERALTEEEYYRLAVSMGKDALDGLTEAKQAEAASTLFGKEAMSGMLNIINASDKDYQELTESIYGCKDAAEEMAGIMQDNLSGQLTILQSGLEGLGISLYETMQDTAKDVVKEAQGMVQQLQDAFDQGGFSGLVGSVGNVLAQVVQKIAGAAPTVIEAAASLVTSFCDGLKSAPGIGESGVTLIMALINGLMACVGQIWSTAAVLITEFLSAFMSQLPQITSAGVDLLNKLAEGIASNLPAMIPAAMEALMQFSGTLRESAGQLVDAGLNLIMTLAQSLIDNIPVFIETIPTIITNIAGIINDNAPKLLASGIGLIGKLAMGIIQAIPTLISNIPQIIEAIVSVFTAFNWVSLGTNIINFITNGIKSLATSIPNAIKNTGQTAMDWLRAINWRTLGSDIIDLIVIGVESLATAIPNLLKSIGSTAVELFKSIDWLDLGVNVVKGIISGITGALDGLWSAIGNLCSGMLDGIKSFFGINSPSTVMAEQGGYLVQGLVNGIASMPAELAAYLDQTVQKIIAWGQQMSSNVQSIIQDVVNTAVDLISQLPGKIWIWLTNTVTKLVQWGQQMLNTARTAISNMISAIVSLMAELPGKVWTWLVNVVTKVTQWGQQMLTTARTAISNMISAIISLMTELPGKVWTWLVNTVTKVTAWGQQMLSSAKTAISNMISAIISQLTQLPGKATGELAKVTAGMVQWGSDIVSKMTDVGKNIVSGIWNGISSGWGWLKDKVANLANSLLDAAKDALGIESPSKEFRDEFGRWLMPGAVEGVKKSMPATLREMEAQAGELLAAMQGTVDASMNEVSLNASGYGDAKAISSTGTTVYNDNHQEQENNYHVPVATPAETAKAQREAFRKMAGGVK